MQQLILVLHILVAIAIIGLVLMQHGRGADVGAAFGSGASNTMFGSAGSLPFLMKVTAICAAIFFTTSITLSYLASHQARKSQMITMPATPVTSSATTKQNPVQKMDDGFSFAPSASDKTK